MTRHTPETVRAALERAGLTVTLGPLQWPDGDAPYRWSFGRGIGDFASEDHAGALWVRGQQIHPPDRYHPNEQRAEAMDPRDARIVELEERVRVLREALGPFAAFADANAYTESTPFRDVLSVHRDQEARVTVDHFLNARAALAATEEK